MIQAFFKRFFVGAAAFCCAFGLFSVSASAAAPLPSAGDSVNRPFYTSQIWTASKEVSVKVYLSFDDLRKMSFSTYQDQPILNSSPGFVSTDFDVLLVPDGVVVTGIEFKPSLPPVIRTSAGNHNASVILTGTNFDQSTITYLKSEESAKTTSFMEGINDFVDWIFQLIPSIGSIIVDNPVILFTTGFLAIGGSVAIFSRFLSKS